MVIFAMKGKSRRVGHASALQYCPHKVNSALHKAWLPTCPQTPVQCRGDSADRALGALLRPQCVSEAQVTKSVAFEYSITTKCFAGNRLSSM